MAKLKGRLIFFLCITITITTLGLYFAQRNSFLSKTYLLFLNSFESLRIHDNKMWDDEFERVKILSSIDQQSQNAFFYKTTSSNKSPLLVSLHTWSGDYSQFDSLSILSKSKNINYIHPDFRGPNNSPEACCSDKALNDIDDAITYAIKNANVDSTKIFVIGASGGGYACLGALMKSKHQIAKFSAWVPITDLKKWYLESKTTKNGYALDILNCTSSMNGKLNTTMAEKRSPIFWKTPVKKLKSSKINIYAGINDGINGSVSISQSIDFYNKLLFDSKVADSSKYVSLREKQYLLKSRKPLANYGLIANRKICLIKRHRNIKLVVFEGNHEMLTTYAFEELLEEK
mgnify:CR=1 FL=1|tara:strand:- start:5308 stop:6342 length:1035 start_codon:yes stop_codon:yes gene_type:complete